MERSDEKIFQGGGLDKIVKAIRKNMDITSPRINRLKPFEERASPGYMA